VELVYISRCRQVGRYLCNRIASVTVLHACVAVDLIIIIERALMNGDWSRTYAQLMLEFILKRFIAFEIDTVKLLMSIFVRWTLS
jgi:hypothetical protein